ncbi:MAG: phage major capsid protein, partial [Alphaproteobacteria bacterium]
MNTAIQRRPALVLPLATPSFIVRAEADPSSPMAAVERALADYHEETKDIALDVKSLIETVDDQAKALSALKVGGISGDNLAPDARRHQALEPLAAFMRTGTMPEAGMSTDSDPDGGYLTNPETDSEIRRHIETVSPMRNVSRVVAIRSDEYKIPFATGQAASGWVTEREARPETTSPKLSQISIFAGELYAEPAATQQILDDATQTENFILDEISNEFVRQENAAFVTGDGVKKPRGLLTFTTTSQADASRAFGTMQYVATGDASGFASTNPGDALVTTLFALHAGYRANSRWMMNSTTAGDIRKFKDSQGRYMWTDSLIEGQPAQLLGRPV